MAFSADSKRLASCSADCKINFWDAVTGTWVHTVEDDGVVHSVAFSEDNQYLASGSSGGKAKVWDTATGKCLHTLEHNDEVTSLAFSADSKCLATGSDDMIIRTWNIKEHSFETLTGHTRWITSVTFSIDSQYLSSGSSDRKLKVWDLEQRMCLHTLDVSTNLYRISFTSWANSQLYADVGILDLEVPNPTPNSNVESTGIPSLSVSERLSHCVNIDGEWIMKNGENLIWLPSGYRPLRSAVFKSIIALGCRSGRVIMMRLSSR